MNFTASRSELDLEPLVVTAGETHVTTHVKLQNYDNPNVRVRYEGNISTPELARILKIAALPAGQVGVSGSARYQFAAKQSFLASTYADGQFFSPRLAVQFDRMSTIAQSVKGSFSVDKGNLHVPDLEADLLKGHLKAQGDMMDLASPSSTRVTVALNGGSLEALNGALPRGSYDRLHLVGNANLEVQAAWPARIENVVAHAHVAITTPQQQPSPQSIPLTGVLDLRYDGPHDTIAFGQSHLQTGSTQVSLNGTVSKQSNLMVQTDTSDLREVNALVSEISAATSSSSVPTPTPFDVHGEAHFSGQVSGAAKDPKIQGQLTANNIQVEGSQWR